MEKDTIYTQANRVIAGMGDMARPGTDVNLGKIQIPHVPIADTPLAACLGVLDVPFRSPGAYTDDVALAQSGSVNGQRKVWWLADSSASFTDDKGHRLQTDFVISAWAQRARFEAEHPLHPLVSMRAAIDAREWWIHVAKAFAGGRARIETDANKACQALGVRDYFQTDSINAASILKACGFRPLAFNQRGPKGFFFVEAMHNNVHAEQLLKSAACEGSLPQQWMAQVLFALGAMLKLVRDHGNVIVRQAHGENQTLLLTADSTSKTREKFFRLLNA